MHKDSNNKNDNAKAKIAHEFYHDDIVVEFGASKTYTNSVRITLLKLLIETCEFVEMEIYG